MGDNFFAYTQQLEMLAFFSGYPLIYYLVRLFTRNASIRNRWVTGLVSIFPFVYPLIGTLYLGLQLKNLYPDYTIENMKHRVQQPYLMIWALLSILCWIPAISKRPLFSILHSLAFFFIIIKDLFFQLTGVMEDRDIIKNDMKVYTVSIFLNLAVFIVIALLSFFLTFKKKYPKS